MITLSADQCRIIGVMLEKETTTPEQYPLSLNAITIGCNQKSNREPVTSFSESDVQNLIDELVEMNQLAFSWIGFVLERVIKRHLIQLSNLNPSY